ncbi:MAG TPA: hypothetical protein VM537_23760 [Anaerolineae bacterium]|nr:hypothetical protein [Anaerolineae bacterium]
MSWSLASMTAVEAQEILEQLADTFWVMTAEEFAEYGQSRLQRACWTVIEIENALTPQSAMFREYLRLGRLCKRYEGLIKRLSKALRADSHIALEMAVGEVHELLSDALGWYAASLEGTNYSM